MLRFGISFNKRGLSHQASHRADMKRIATLATLGHEKFTEIAKICDQNHAFYVRKFRNTNGSVEANISHQIVENVKPKDLQAEDTYSH